MPPSATRRRAVGKGTVGVYFDRTSLWLARTDRKGNLLDYHHVPVPPGLEQSGPGLSAFLETALSGFCGPGRHDAIWAALPGGRVNVRPVQIPNVARKQIANTIYWTFRKDEPFDETATVFDFATEGTTVVDGTRRRTATAYTAAREDVDTVRESFARAGFQLTGLTVPLFAFRNLLASPWVSAPAGRKVVLLVEDEYTRIAVVEEGMPVLSRSIKSGIDTLVESLREELEFPVDLPRAREFLGRLTGEVEPAAEASAPLLRTEEIFEMVRAPVNRLLRNIERTLEYYSVSLTDENIVAVYLSGSISPYRMLVDYIGKRLAIPVQLVDPFAAGLFDGTPPPQPHVQVSAFAHAVALSLSGASETPNLLFTYRDKESIAQAGRANQGIFAGFVLLAVVCVLMFAWLHFGTRIERTRQGRLENELAAYEPQADMETLTALAVALGQRQKELAQNSSTWDWQSSANCHS